MATHGFASARGAFYRLVSRLPAQRACSLSRARRDRCADGNCRNHHRHPCHRTFRIPGGAIGALSAFLLSRESLLSTAQSALYLRKRLSHRRTLHSYWRHGFFASVPITHFLWEGVSLFIMFFLLRTLTNYVVAINLGAIATSIFASGIFPARGSKMLSSRCGRCWRH